MRVLIVSQYFWPENFRINEVAATLREKGNHVDVLTGQPNYPQGKVFPGFRAWSFQNSVHLGVGVHRLPLYPRGKGGARLSLNYLSFVLSGLLFGPWRLRKKQYDAIFIFAPSPILQAIPALLLGKLKKCPTILWVQDLWPESLSATGHVRNHMILGWVGWLTRFIYKHTDLLLVQSKAFVEPVAAMAAGTPIAYFPNSVDDTFAAATQDLPNEAPRFDSGFSVLFAGNIGVAQAVDVIVDAAILLKEYPDVQFIIVGDGSRREEVLRRVRQHNLSNVQVPGRFPHETMPAFMQKASALLVTLADQEIFAATVPSKVQAYMAAGRPIVACINGEGARLVVEAGAGFATPAEDAEALADTIMRLYKLTEEERKNMGDNGRKYYREHFVHDQLVDQLVGHLQAELHRYKDNK